VPSTSSADEPAAGPVSPASGSDRDTTPQSGSDSSGTSTGRSELAQPFSPPRDLNDRLVLDLIDAVKGMIRKESADRLRDVYLIGDIEKDIARNVCESWPTTASGRSRSTSTAPAAMSPTAWRFTIRFAS
jgi:hypothetical protein